MDRQQEKVKVAVIGLHNQGRLVGLCMLETGKAEIAAVCDVDDAEMERVGADFTAHANQAGVPNKVKDFREVLADPEVEAVVIATPDHWHAVQTVLACRAGKDVYVEKPLSWCIAEGRAMVEAARKHDRIVQVGSQQRGGAHFREAVEMIRSGRIGKVSFAKGWIYHIRKDVGRPPDGPVPDGVDYDLWLGPAPERPFNPNRFHYDWRWYWDYSTGEMGNWGAHWLDIVRWGLNLDVPQSAAAYGGKHQFTDDRDTYDTQMVLYEFPGVTVQWEMLLWSKHPLDGQSHGAAFYGSEGTLVVSRRGWWLYGSDGKTLAEERPGSDDFVPHAREFLDSVRTRKKPLADVEEGHKSAIMCHLGNISLHLGRKLDFYPKTERFPGDEEANRYLARSYREPWGLEV